MLLVKETKVWWRVGVVMSQGIILPMIYKRECATHLCFATAEAGDQEEGRLGGVALRFGLRCV